MFDAFYDDENMPTKWKKPVTKKKAFEGMLKVLKIDAIQAHLVTTLGQEKYDQIVAKCKEKKSMYYRQFQQEKTVTVHDSASEVENAEGSDAASSSDSDYVPSDDDDASSEASELPVEEEEEDGADNKSEPDSISMDNIEIALKKMIVQHMNNVERRIITELQDVVDDLNTRIVKLTAENHEIKETLCQVMAETNPLAAAIYKRHIK